MHYICIYERVLMHALCMYICMYVCTHIHICIHICTQTYVDVYIIYICTMHICNIYIILYLWIHIYIYVYKYDIMCMCVWVGWGRGATGRQQERQTDRESVCRKTEYICMFDNQYRIIYTYSHVGIRMHQLIEEPAVLLQSTQFLP